MIEFELGAIQYRLKNWFIAAAIITSLIFALEKDASADEGGVPFWLSGQFASFAAVPQAPGWYQPVMLYYYSGDASDSKSFPRGSSISAGLDSQAPLLFLAPTFVPDAKFLGGQPSFSVAFGGGYNETSAKVSLSNSNTLTLNKSDTIWGVTDLYPLVSVAWTKDVHNWMIYATGDIPAGSYDSDRLANTRH